MFVQQNRKSIDELFGLAPGSGADPLAPGNPLARPTGVTGDDSSADPLLAFGAAPNVKRGSAQSQRDDTPALYGSFRMPEVKPDARASDVRKGDVLLMLAHKGQQTELKSVEQFNKLLSSLDKNAVITLQVKRGEMMAFVTISGLTDKG